MDSATNYMTFRIANTSLSSTLLIIISLKSFCNLQGQNRAEFTSFLTWDQAKTEEILCKPSKLKFLILTFIGICNDFYYYIFSTHSFFTSYFFFLRMNQRNVWNMRSASNWISQTGSTKKYFLFLLRLHLFNILKNYYLISRIIFRSILTYKKKNSFHKQDKTKSFFLSNQLVPKLLLEPSTLL